VANLLRKSPTRTVVGGTPALPGQPDTRHYAWVSVITGPLQMMVYIDYYKGKPRKLLGMRYPTKRVWQQVGLAPVPAQPAVPGVTVVKGAAGWDGGARTVAAVSVGASFTCVVPAGVIGVMVCLARDSSLRNESWIDYGIRFQVREDARIVEAGKEVKVLAGVRTTKPWTVTVRRAGDAIYYMLDGELVHTTMRQDNRVLYGAAVLYSDQDAVRDAVIAAATSGAVTGTIPRPIPTIYDAEYSSVIGRLPLPGLTMDSSSTQGGQVQGRTPKMTAIITDRNYGLVDGRVPRPALSAALGSAPIEFVSAGGLVPRPGVYIHGLAGEVATVNAVQPRILGLITGYPADAPRASYGSVGGVWPTSGYQGALIPIDTAELTSGHISLNQALLIGENYELDQPILLVISDGIRAGATVQFQMLAAAALHEMVTVSGGLELSGEMAAVIRSAITCREAVRFSTPSADGSGNADNGALFPGNAAMGYAVNIITGALAEYDGQQFTHMARAGGQLWAIGPDGLYRLAEGGTLSALLDLGTTGNDANSLSCVANAFVGIRTDGELYLRATTDGAEHIYRAIPRGDTYRFDLAKGVSARNWSFSLELMDASYASIDSVEFLVGATTRRRGGRR